MGTKVQVLPLVLAAACVALGSLSAPFACSDDWTPPAPANDGSSDWLQLTSGEWIRGRIVSMQDEELCFDSEELDLLTVDWKDVQVLRSSRLQSMWFGDRGTFDGSLLVISGEVRIVSAAGTNAFPRSALLSIVPSGRRERIKWSGGVSLGLSRMEGNTTEGKYNADIRLQRQTPVTRLTLEYQANYGKINGVESENDQRGLARYDHFLSRQFFVRAPDFEYYKHALENLSHRATLGGSAGYAVIKGPRAEWSLTAGPAYQRNWFESVEAGEPDSADSFASVFGTRFDVHLTQRVEYILEYRGQFSRRAVGGNLHHGESTLEFEVHKFLKLAVSFVWDRTADPEPREDGTTPESDDYRLVTSLGARF